jgi:hypothetical protein
MNSEREHRRLWAWVLAATLTLNAVLGVVMLKRLHAEGLPHPMTSSQSRARVGLPPPSADDAPGEVVVISNSIPFRWACIESEDYVTYVAHLRAIGCPEPLVRDLVAAELKELYAAHTPAPAGEISFWTGGMERQQHLRELEATGRERETECRRVYSALTGADWPSETRSDLDEGVSLTILFLGFLSPERRQHVLALLEELDRATDQVEAEAQHLLLPADKERLEAVYGEWRSRAAALFSPAEIEELSLRAGVFSLDPTPDVLEGLLMTGTELRQVLQLLWDGSDPHFCLFSREHNLGPNTDLDDLIKDPDCQQKVAYLLGPDRARAFFRNLDPDFGPLRDFTRRQHLPEDLVRRLFESQKAIMAAVAELRADPSLPVDEYDAQAAMVIATYEAVIRQSLAPDLAVACLENTADWRRQALQRSP